MNEVACSPVLRGEGDGQSGLRGETLGRDWRSER